MSCRIKDMTGYTSGKLSVIKYGGTKNGRAMWVCKCECGKETLVDGGNLRRKHSSSCGCLATERITKHNTTHGMRDTRIYDCWRDMKDRCNNSNNSRYGGRGITYDERWNTFENFYEDMREGYSYTKTLDRIDYNGNYSKSNCKWSTVKEQSHNRSNNKIVIYKGEERRLVELYSEIGCTIKYKTVLDRLYSGWSAERALTEPVRGGTS